MLAKNENNQWVVVLGRSSFGNHLHTRPLLADVLVKDSYWLIEIGLPQADNLEHIDVVDAALYTMELGLGPGTDSFWTEVEILLNRETVPVTARWVYVIMVAEDHGLHAPFQIPYRRIYGITGFSTSTIHRAIESLVDGGFMSYDHGGLEQNPNVYDLESSWLKLERGTGNV